MIFQYKNKDRLSTDEIDELSPWDIEEGKMLPPLEIEKKGIRIKY